jgi:amidohydrolase
MPTTRRNKLKRISIIFLISFFSFLFIPNELLPLEKVTEKKIQDIIKEITPELISIRRDIHCHPELSFQEKRTAALAAEYFQKLGLEVRTGIGVTGVLGVLRGGKPGPVVGMRGDMDALPITEETNIPFASKAKAEVEGREVGVMHSCGHDIHTTLLLGVANVLSRLRKDLRGTVLFIAQPAEEWGDGANRMLRDGVFKDIKPEALFAYHVEDTIPAGFIKYTPGYSAANCDGFVLKIKSGGCHGADPASCVDPIVVGSQVVIALQVMVSREIDVHKDTVITVGSFHAGTASNIIPKEANLSATIRSYEDEQRKSIKEKVTRLITNLCGAAGAEFDLNYYYGTPALYNNPDLLKEIFPSIEKALGGKKFLIEDLPGMGGEDFSYFAQQIPSVMLNLGVLPKDIPKTSVHSPTFVADEESIPLGTKVMCSVILDYLAGHKAK